MPQVRKMKEQPEKFHLIVPEPECTNVSFWYIPKRLRDEKRDHYWEDELGKCTAIIKVRRIEEFKKKSVKKKYHELSHPKPVSRAG